MRHRTLKQSTASSFHITTNNPIIQGHRPFNLKEHKASTSHCKIWVFFYDDGDSVVVFWFMKPCSVVEYRHFGGPCCFQLQMESTSYPTSLHCITTQKATTCTNHRLIQTYFTQNCGRFWGTRYGPVKKLELKWECYIKIPRQYSGRKKYAF